MEKIVTISGKARHGKDLSAKIIKDKLEQKGKKVFVAAFADYMKFMANKYFGYKGDEYKHIPEQRHILQWLGTDVVRTKNPDFWVNAVANLITILEDEYDVCLITDCRFPNECRILSDTYEVINLKVHRINFDNGLTEEQKQHPSEISLDDWQFDYYVESESIQELESKLDIFIKEKRI